MVLLLRKLYLYFTKHPEAVHYFPGGGGGGCPTFSRCGGGPNAIFQGVSEPPIPLWIRTWAMSS